jgi:hypothetical protein
MPSQTHEIRLVNCGIRDVWREKTSIFDVKFGNPKCYILIVARKV